MSGTMLRPVTRTVGVNVPLYVRHGATKTSLLRIHLLFGITGTGSRRKDCIYMQISQPNLHTDSPESRGVHLHPETGAYRCLVNNRVLPIACNFGKLRNLHYYDRLERLNVLTLELRRLRADLLWCYKVVFGLVHVNVNEFFKFSPCHNTRGHKYKLFKHQTTARVRSIFFCERVVNIWNSLPDDVSFDSFLSVSIMRINLNSHLRYCGRLSWFSFSFIYFTRAINTVNVIYGDYQCIFQRTWTYVQVRYMLSPFRLSSVCRLSVFCLSVTLVHPTQPVEIFGNFSSPPGTLAIPWHSLKILRRSSQGNPSVRGCKRKRGSEV